MTLWDTPEPQQGILRLLSGWQDDLYQGITIRSLLNIPKLPPTRLSICTLTPTHLYPYCCSSYLDASLHPSSSPIHMHKLETDSLRGSSVKIGTVQRILAWPLRKDDVHRPRGVNKMHKLEMMRCDFAPFGTADPNRTCLAAVRHLAEPRLSQASSRQVLTFRLSAEDFPGQGQTEKNNKMCVYIYIYIYTSIYAAQEHSARLAGARSLLPPAAPAGRELARGLRKMVLRIS